MTRNTYRDFPSQESVPGYWWEHQLDPDYMQSVMPPTPWDARLLNHIGTHLAAENNAAASYESLAEMGDPQVRYLARMVAADEHRHHRMLVELMDSVRSVAECERDGSTWGTTSTLDGEQRAALVKAVEELIHVEKTDAADLKQLRHDLRSAPDGTLWPVIVAIMELDTEKHLRILKVIERSLKRRHVQRTDTNHGA